MQPVHRTVQRAVAGTRADYLSPVRITAIHSRAFRSLTAASAITCAAAAFAAPRAVAQGEPPLAGLAAQRVSVMPVQFLRADSAAPIHAAQWDRVRHELDDSIGTAIAERGVGKKWSYAADIARMAKRNSDYVSDPYTLGATSLRTGPIKAGDQAPSILITNMRSLIALGDSRFAVVPVELTFERRGADARAVLRLLLIDGRSGQISWYADINSPVSGSFASAEIGALAGRVADLVIRR